jgi:holo-[acyl-carrier protein] synthase
MIVGFGLDIVETERIERMLAAHGLRFRARVFTPAEVAACADRRDEAQALAARFAAKEACLKALGSGWRLGIGFRDIEVVRLEGGAPSIRFSGGAAEQARKRGVRSVHVTLTHQPGLAAAAVILEG